MMNELKPEDVMSALESWIYDFKGTATQFCALCDAITLLKKYQAENAEKDAEIERLKAHNKELDNLCDLLHKKLDEGYAEFANEERADAITEFAERLKAKAESMPMYSHLKIVYTSDIDKIAKELKEAPK